MTKTLCQFHPTRAAAWRCWKCGICFCPQCAVARNPGRSGSSRIYLCPRCNLQAEWLGIGNLIEPFWSRLPKFFLYPFFPGPLLLNLVLAAIYSLSTGPSLFSGLIRLALWGVVLKYSFAALKTTARGDLFPPPVRADTISNEFQEVFKQLGIFLVIGISSVMVFQGLGPLAGSLFLLAAVLSIPAMIMTFVTTGSLLCAVNPMFFGRLALRIGWGYLLLYFFFTLLGGAPAFLAASVLQHLPPLLHRFLLAFCQNFYTILTYHLMGYVVLQYSGQIGYAVDFEDYRDPAARKAAGAGDPAAGILLQVEARIKSGQYDDAIECIERHARGDGITDLALSERYFNLLKLRGRDAAMMAHAPRLLDLLARENRKQPALRIYSDCRAKDDRFAPPPQALFKIGGWLGESGKVKEAISAYNLLVKRYPGDDQAPRAYFRAAQLFNDRFMAPDKARRILTSLLEQFPDHEIIPQVRNYLATI